LYSLLRRQGVKATVSPLAVAFLFADRGEIQAEERARLWKKVSALKAHPLNERLYGNEELPQGFIASIQTQGILVPLAVKANGTIISGHRRWRAAQALGMDTVPVQIVAYDNELDEREAIVEFNRQREKTFSQKMAEAEELKAIESERARKRQAEAGKANLPTVSGGNISTTQQSEKGKTRDKVAQAIGLGSGRTYEKAAKVWEAAKQGDETAKKVVAELDAGKKTINAAYKQVVVHKQRQEQAEAIRKEPPPLPTGPFRIIVADPPWHYDKRPDDPTHRAALPYPSMTVDEICALPVQKLAADDAVLWLWATNAHLPDAFSVVEAWGFRYKTCLTWVKDRMGTGDWLRGQTEHCLMAIRGKPVVMLTNQTTVLHGPVREHSRKPDEFYQLVEELCPGSKVELFARTQREGWIVHGDEIHLFT